MLKFCGTVTSLLLLAVMTTGCGNSSSSDPPPAAGIPAGIPAGTPRQPPSTQPDHQPDGLADAGPGRAAEPLEVFAKDASTPQKALDHFLRAIQQGDDQTADQLLTVTARTAARETGLRINLGQQTPFSAKAKFEFAKMEYVQEELPDGSSVENRDGVRVLCQITDVDTEGSEFSDQIIWGLRREPQGWRVGGMSFELFKDEPWMILNFEDPLDVRRQQQLAEAEIVRRQQQPQARKPGQEGPSF